MVPILPVIPISSIGTPWIRVAVIPGDLVPKLRLGTRRPKLRFEKSNRKCNTMSCPMTE
jgi:hypothetical protein